ESDALSLHGLWQDIGEGNLMYYDAEKGRFSNA
ncbi:carbonic anhydrase, partial [Escherichia coli]|nr:carbonic anhydrase [Escherichia coli]